MDFLRSNFLQTSYKIHTLVDLKGIVFVVVSEQFHVIIQGRNQDLNPAKQKYEILTGHRNRC